MLLTENIVLRCREWRDRRTDEPDLVPRMKRLWGRELVERVPQKRGARSLLALGNRPALEAPRGA